MSTLGSCYNGINTYWERFNCCLHIPWYRCVEITLAWIQLATYFLCWQMVYITSLVVWPRVRENLEQKQQLQQKQLHWVVFTTYMLGSFVGAGVIVYWNKLYSPTSRLYLSMDATIGILSALAMAAYLAPQVYTTWKLQDMGSLSMITVILSIVGTGITTYFLLQYDATPWIYVPGLIATFFFLVLLVMCAHFSHKRKITFWEFIWPTDKKLEDDVELIMSEKTPLK
eukprot:TRINITY_DN4422_c0_g1_i14.p1 TRINITY_DN4422_c0_g1~~TRINITY_DN4422_c0_g1_i14.p1  ORF type:complete len:227 (+),score=39.07 TRINITY_DN4422_c0_g1_i14:335-1015(+)